MMAQTDGLETSSATPVAATETGRGAVLTLSTAGFTLMFAVWLMFGVLGIPIRKEFRLTELQFGWLTAIAVLNGSLWRLLFGILTDRYGGRIVMTALIGATAIPAFFVSRATSYPELMVYAFLVGMAGNAFSVGIAWNSAWFPKHRQGFSLGVFGAGNVGASVTKFIGPTLIAIVPAAGLASGFVPGGWRFVPFLYCVLLVVMAIATWVLTPAHDKRPGQGRSFAEMLKPLAFMRVWRFSLYYVVVFGAYVALSVWLPKYYVDVYHFRLQTAALLTALFIFPASLLRPLGGWLSDKVGARRLMYWIFSGMLLALIGLSIPNLLGPVPFTALVFVVGVGMGIGKAAVYKYIPDYFPKDVGAVGGIVGLLGALGGFFLPLLFAHFKQSTGLPTSTFMVLAGVTAVSFVWLHVVVSRLRREGESSEHQIEQRQ